MKKLGLLTIILVTLTSVSFPQTATQIKKANKLVEQGNEFSDKKEWDKAIAAYTEVIKIRPNRPNAFINRGIAKYEQATEVQTKVGDNARNVLESAVADFTQAIKLKPENLYDVLMSRGNAYWVLQQIDSDKFRPLAIADYTQAIKLNPKLETAYFQRGDCFERNLEYDKAIADFTKAFQINSNYDEALVKRGWAYSIQNKLGLALIDFERATKINPNGKGKSSLQSAMYQLNKNERPYEVISNEAKSALDKGEVDDAIALYQKSIELLPLDWNSNLTKLTYAAEKAQRIAQISQAYLRKQDYDKALDLYETANKSFYDELSRQFESNTINIDKSDLDITILNLSSQLIFWEHDLDYWSKFIEMTRTSLKSFSIQPLSSQQKIRMTRFEILANAQSQAASSRFTLVAVYQYTLATLCKGRAADICGVNSHDNKFTENYEKMLITVNKGIEIYPNLKMSYQRRAEIYRFMGKNELAAADEQKASQLKND